MSEVSEQGGNKTVLVQKNSVSRLKSVDTSYHKGTSAKNISTQGQKNGQKCLVTPKKQSNQLVLKNTPTRPIQPQIPTHTSGLPHEHHRETLLDSPGNLANKIVFKVSRVAGSPVKPLKPPESTELRPIKHQEAKEWPELSGESIKQILRDNKELGEQNQRYRNDIMMLQQTVLTLELQISRIKESQASLNLKVLGYTDKHNSLLERIKSLENKVKQKRLQIVEPHQNATIGYLTPAKTQHLNKSKACHQTPLATLTNIVASTSKIRPDKVNWTPKCNLQSQQIPSPRQKIRIRNSKSVNQNVNSPQSKNCTKKTRRVSLTNKAKNNHNHEVSISDDQSMSSSEELHCDKKSILSKVLQSFHQIKDNRERSQLRLSKNLRELAVLRRTIALKCEAVGYSYSDFQNEMLGCKEGEISEDNIVGLLTGYPFLLSRRQSKVMLGYLLPSEQEGQEMSLFTCKMAEFFFINHEKIGAEEQEAALISIKRQLEYHYQDILAKLRTQEHSTGSIDEKVFRRVLFNYFSPREVDILVMQSLTISFDVTSISYAKYLAILKGCINEKTPM